MYVRNSDFLIFKIEKMDQKNFKKCHSRNLDQTDLILDFLSNLDKSKNSFTWRDELNQINQDWTQMMTEKDGAEDDIGQEHQQQLHQEEPPLSPSKRVTWSDKLTNVKTISPPRSQNYDQNRQIDIHLPRLQINPDCDQIQMGQNPVRRNIKYQYTPEGVSDFRSSPQKHYHQHNHHQPHHRNLHQFEPGRAAPKMRLISIVPNHL